MFSTIDFAVLEELALERGFKAPTYKSYISLVAEGFVEYMTSGLIVKTPLLAEYFCERGWRVVPEHQRRYELEPGKLVFVVAWGESGAQPVREVDGQLVWTEDFPRHFFQYQL